MKPPCAFVVTTTGSPIVSPVSGSTRTTVTSSLGPKSVPVTVVSEPAGTLDGSAVMPGSRASSSARTVEEPRSMFATLAAGSTSRLSALTVKDSAPSFPGEGCSLMVTSATWLSASKTGDSPWAMGSMMPLSVDASPLPAVEMSSEATGLRMPRTTGISRSVSTPSSSSRERPRRLPSTVITGSSSEVPARAPRVVWIVMSMFDGRTRTVSSAPRSMTTSVLLRTSSTPSVTLVVSVPSASATAEVMPVIVWSSNSRVLGSRPLRLSTPCASA